MKKIIFVAQNLQMGGIQKALTNMLYCLPQYIDIDKFEIDLFVFGDGSLVDEVPSYVNVAYGSNLLKLISTPVMNVRRYESRWRLFLRLFMVALARIAGREWMYYLLFTINKKRLNSKKYDIAVSYFNDVPGKGFNAGTNLCVDKFISASKKVAWIHTDPINAGFDKNYCRHSYKSFDNIVCVSEACKKKFQEFLPEYFARTSVVYNFFPTEKIKKLADKYRPFEEDSDILTLVSVGRIDNATKRFNLIPAICKEILMQGFTKFRWYIVGDGPDLEKNEERVCEYGVGDIVKFVGNKENPYPYIKHADMLVLISAYEGYPMVVGEALHLGIPVAAIEYAAVKEQIEDGVNGFVLGYQKKEIVETLSMLLIKREKIEECKNRLKKQKLDNAVAAEQLYALFDMPRWEMQK